MFAMLIYIYCKYEYMSLSGVGEVAGIPQNRTATEHDRIVLKRLAGAKCKELCFDEQIANINVVKIEFQHMDHVHNFSPIPNAYKSYPNIQKTKAARRGAWGGRPHRLGPPPPSPPWGPGGKGGRGAGGWG